MIGYTREEKVNRDVVGNAQDNTEGGGEQVMPPQVISPPSDASRARPIT